MNYTDHTERLHTFADVPRITINRWHITAHDDRTAENAVLWDSEPRTTVQLGCEHDAIPAAIVDFLANLHGSPYRSKEDIELLRRFAGALGLDYTDAPGIK